jgi:hypothetical protein
MKVNGAAVNLEDGAEADGKSSKTVMEPILQPGPQNRWGVWVTGFGDFVNVDGDANAQGYNFTTGGVSLSLDYRITDQLAISVMGEYSRTWTDLNPGGHINVDSGRGGVYATWFSHGIYTNGAIYGGHNNYDSGRPGRPGHRWESIFRRERLADPPGYPFRIRRVAPERPGFPSLLPMADREDRCGTIPQSGLGKMNTSIPPFRSRPALPGFPGPQRLSSDRANIASY